MNESEKEFAIGDVVRLDRYNPIDEIPTATVIGYGRMPLSGRLTYKLDVNGVTIESTGASIMESRYYFPVPLEQRHAHTIRRKSK